MTDAEDASDDGDVRTRNVGVVIASEHVTVFVDHVFSMRVSPEYGTPDEGMVGLLIDDDEEGDDGRQLSALLSAEEALLLADRLQRAAGLVLEVAEDLPDAEREYRRHTRGGEHA
jgi:hypothetical protein